MRTAVAAGAQMRHQTISFSGPNKGLVLEQSLARSVDGGAEFLEGWIPTDRGARVRGGMVKSATVGQQAVTSMFVYNRPVTSRMFAATATAIYDVSALDPDNVPATSVTGQSSGYYSAEQIGLVGGNYLYAVNGTNDALLYDGSSWQAVNGASSPIAITGVSTDTFSSVWKYRSRVFFVEKDSLNAWYLPVDQVGGAALSVSLAGIFKRGGSLLFGATWSLDAGDGIDDKWVVVSTEGEVAVYEGADPSSASDWRLVGRYDVAKPLGVNATMQAGGDLLIATLDGVVPLSEVIQKDPAAIELSAVSRPIEPLWRQETLTVNGTVELIKWSARGLGIVTLPGREKVLAVNLQTGGWAPQPGWPATCGTTFLNGCYIGTDDGRILAIDEGGTDDGLPYTVKYTASFSGLGDVALKQARLIRFVFFAPSTFTYRASVAVNYEGQTFPSAPNDAGLVDENDYLVWDQGNWDGALWWSPAVMDQSRQVTTKFVTVQGRGHALAPQLQITSGGDVKPNIELLRTDLVVNRGATVR